MTAVQKKPASTLLLIIAFAIVYIVWGSTYFFIQQAMVSFPPMMLGALRFLAAGLIMLAWSWFRGEKIFDRGDLVHIAISGVLMLFIGTGAVIWVEQYLPSAMVAIMVSSSPLWFILLDKAKWAENFHSRLTVGGLIAGFGGVLVLFSEKIIAAFSGEGPSADMSSLAILVIGSMAWAGGSLYSKYKGSSLSLSATSAWQMLAAGVAFSIPAVARGEHNAIDWANITAGAWGSILYLVFFGSIAGFSAYVWLLSVKPATQVSTHAYVNPVVAVLLGVFFASEQISLVQVIGLVIILASVLVINIVKYRKEKAARALQEAELAAEPLQVNVRKPAHQHAPSKITDH